MISGMYMGEIVRVILLRVSEARLIFDADFTVLSTPHCIPTKYVSEIERFFPYFSRTLHKQF